MKLSDLGRREEALAAIEEAVAIRSELATVDPDAFRSDLAGSLKNLSIMLNALGHRRKALKAIEDAVRIYRALAAVQPKTFGPELAGSLSNLSAVIIGDVSRGKEALIAIEEAVEIYRELVVAYPHVFRVELARSLLIRARCLEAVDNLDAALQADGESIALLTTDFSRRPQVHAALMQMICRDYLRRCAKAGVEPEEALLAPVDAVFERMQRAGMDSAARTKE